MPLDRPTLTTADVRALTAAAFVPGQVHRWGLEVEVVVGHAGEPCRRPAVAELPSRADLPSGSRLTVEPGGQLEISTLPHHCVDDALDTVAADEVELAARLATAGLRAMPGAVDVYRRPQRILDLPRYRAMEAFFDAGGPEGRLMMCNTASLQVNVSHHPADPARWWRLLHALGPVLVATFANSPGSDAAGHRWASLRQRIWAGIDPHRTAPLDAHSDPAATWARYALDADVMFVRTPGGAVDLPPGLSFARWMRDGHPAGWPDADDLAVHLTTLFPPIRPRGWLELRMLDAQPPAVREVAVLVIAACLADAVAAELEVRLPDTASWWTAAARHGLRHGTLGDAAELLFDVIAPALPDVTDRPDRIDRVLRYRDSHVRRRLQPWAGAPAAELLTRSG